MQEAGIRPDKYIYTGVLRACADTGVLDLGIYIHNLVVEYGLESDVVVGSSLILLYFKCGAAYDAIRIFSKLTSRNTISWNTVISYCNEHGYSDVALVLYEEMQQHGIKPEASTYSSILKACGSTGALDQGKLIHGQLLRSGHESNVIVSSTLVDMYSKCGDLTIAREIFEKTTNRDIMSWGAMLSGYVDQGKYQSALELYANFLQEHITPNNIIFVCILKACVRVGTIEDACYIHHHIVGIGGELDNAVGNILVDMYASCGSLNEALKLFTTMPEKGVIAWNTIIGAYAEHGQGKNALMLYSQMQKSLVKPDKVTYLSILKACVTMGASCLGRMIHHQILEDSLDLDTSIVSSLVDMYAKCGGLQEALILFEELPDKNIISWGILINGYVQQGYHEMVDQCIRHMIQQGLIPTPIIYVNVFASCSHAGRVEDTKKYLNSMVVAHGVSPTEEHFNCMIDVFGRAGCLIEGKKLLQSMPMDANITCWMSLLAACGTYGDIDLAKQSFDELVRMDPDYASAYILMSKIYTDMDMQENADNIIEQMRSLTFKG
ncbi:hypothetical protein KP509_06G085600 [Ceratopteris richardii]|nr:hypothetical protein KP509_06G085600 [Ceratopteris richardii]